MKRTFIALVFAAGMVLTSCSPKITANFVRTYEPLESVDDVVMFAQDDRLPGDAEWIGSIDVKGQGGYNKLASLTRFRAWESGAKYVKIKKFSSDGVRDDVHVMSSDVYLADNSKYESVDIPVANNYSNVQGQAPGANRSVASGISNALTVNKGEVNTNVAPDIYYPAINLGNNTFRFFVGYGRRLNKVSGDLSLFDRERVKRLMNGVVSGGEYIRFIGEKGNGVGFTYHLYYSSTSEGVTMTFDDNSVEDGVYTETSKIRFMGPLYASRLVSRNGKHVFTDNISLGVIMLDDDQTFNKHEKITTGYNLGYSFDINWQYFITDKLSIGADLSYTAGVLRNITVKEGGMTRSYELDKDHYEGLVHMALCAQLVYTF